MAGMNERPPVTIRVNRLRGSREDLARRVRDDELAETRPTVLAPEGLVVVAASSRSGRRSPRAGAPSRTRRPC